MQILKTNLFKTFILMSLALFGHSSYAFDCTSKASGFFHVATTWNNCNNTSPQPTDNATINANHTVYLYGVSGNVQHVNVNNLIILRLGTLLKSINNQKSNINVNNLIVQGTMTIYNESDITVSDILINDSTGSIKLIAHRGTITVDTIRNENTITTDINSSTQFYFDTFSNYGSISLAAKAFTKSLTVNQTIYNYGNIFTNFQALDPYNSTTRSLNPTGLSTSNGELIFNNFYNDSTGRIAMDEPISKPNLKISGYFNNLNPNLSLEKFFVFLNGSTLNQPITGLYKVFSLALNNPYGAILNSNLVLGYSTNYNGGLVLLDGKLETSSSSYITYLLGCYDYSNTNNAYLYRNPGSWVSGRFSFNYPRNSIVNCTFPIGTEKTYSPISFSVTKGGGSPLSSVNFTFQTIHGEHPDTIANTNGITTPLSVNKYLVVSSSNYSGIQSGLEPIFTFDTQVCIMAGNLDCPISDLDTNVFSNSFTSKYKVVNSWTTNHTTGVPPPTDLNTRFIYTSSFNKIGTLVFASTGTNIPPSSTSNYATLDTTVLSTWSSTARKPLFTKISGIPFTLDVAALKSDGTVESNLVNASNPTRTVKLELFNYNSSTACSTYTSPITSQNVTFTTSNSHYSIGRVTSSSITVNSSHKEVIARITDSSVTPAIQSCSSDTFTIRPSQLLLLNTSASADSTGANNSSSVIIPTGNSFSMTAGTNTIGYNGIPSINATKINWSNLPSGGQIGALTGSFSAANAINGNDSIGNNFTYSEVGYFNFLAQGIYDENFISSNDVNNGDCTLNYSNTLSSDKYGCYFGNIAPTTHLGRFVPSTFTLTNTTLVNRVDSSCTPTSSFSYLTEPLSISTRIQALNQNGEIVKNYSGNFNRFDSLSFNLRANTSTNNLSNKINLISQTGNFINGVNNYSTKFSLNRDSNPTNPYLNTIISSAFNDLDNIKSTPNNDSNLDTIPDSTLLGNTNFYFGRLRLANNKGSDLVPLKLDLFTQYFDTNSFKAMTLDSCTTLSTNRFSTSNFVGDLAANEVSFTYPSPLKTNNGVLSILMNKPSAGDGKYAGTFEFNYDLLSDNKTYLQSQWTGTSSYNQNPKSQITISKKTNNVKFLFIKEMY